MMKKLFQVEDRFQITGRGLVLTPGISRKELVEADLRMAHIILVRPDGHRLPTRIVGTSFQETTHIQVEAHLSIEDIPIGTEVFLAEPYFSYRNIPPSKQLTYELLNNSNSAHIYEMFQGDDNPFLSPDYTALDRLKRYMELHLLYTRNSQKRGGCDWLVRWKLTGEYIALLNLYDLNAENYSDVHQRCTIGFSTKASWRRKGISEEAVRSMINHIFHEYPEKETVLAYTEKDNIASVAFLKKLGFTPSKRSFTLRKKYDYFELQKTI